MKKTRSPGGLCRTLATFSLVLALSGWGSAWAQDTYVTDDETPEITTGQGDDTVAQVETATEDETTATEPEPVAAEPVEATADTPPGTPTTLYNLDGSVYAHGYVLPDGQIVYDQDGVTRSIPSSTPSYSGGVVVESAPTVVYESSPTVIYEPPTYYDDDVIVEPGWTMWNYGWWDSRPGYRPPHRPHWPPPHGGPGFHPRPPRPPRPPSHVGRPPHRPGGPGKPGIGPRPPRPPRPPSFQGGQGGRPRPPHGRPGGPRPGGGGGGPRGGRGGR